MANYSNLKDLLDRSIYTNTQRAITGDVLNTVLKAMVDSLGNGYQYKGLASTSTNPGTPDCNVLYLASAPGTYTYFGGTEVTDGELAFLKWNGTWTKDSVTVATSITLDDNPTEGSNNAVKSGGIYSSLQGKQDTLVSGSNIKTVNETSILGPGNITVEEGIGFDSITTPSTPDGSMEIVLTNGDTITVDLNHNHPQYLKYVYLTSESQMPVSPDSTTLYLILDDSNA